MNENIVDIALSIRGDKNLSYYVLDSNKYLKINHLQNTTLFL